MAKSAANASDAGPGAGGAGALSFEEAVTALERIVEQIESGEIGLERAVAEYERGVALIARCRQILDQAEQRVTELSVPADARPRAARANSGATPPADADEPPF